MLAIAAFGKSFGISDSELANAIWQAAGNSNYASTTTYSAADYYVNSWTGPNLTASSSSGYGRVVNGNWLVGPFTITYDAGDYGTIYFTKDFTYSIKDQNGNDISGATIVDGSIPGTFYVQFPYTLDITSVTVNASVNYIDSISGSYQDYITQAYVFRYGMGAKSTSRDGYVASSYYSSASGGQWIFYATAYAHSTAIISLRKTSNGNAMQDMRTISGSINWASTSASATIALYSPTSGDDDDDDDDDDDTSYSNSMDIAGYVWEDGETGKNSSFDGSLGTGDTRLAGIEVYLYTSSGTLVKQDSGNMRYFTGSNPTITNSNGYYEFLNVDPTQDYYVVFVYDGMLYTNTYGAGLSEYNTDPWCSASKGSEMVSERNNFNKKFVTISSYPTMYKTTAIFSGSYLTNGYNLIYSTTDETLAYYKQLVTNRLNAYLTSGTYISSDSEYISAIYQPILNSITDSSKLTEAKQVLQYIWDCRIKSYAGNQSIQDGSTKLTKTYPYYDNIVLVDVNGNRVSATSEGQYNGSWIIYRGQLHINQGLIKRPSTDLELVEDVSKAVVSINGKDETYTYGSLSKKQVNLSSSDVMTYTQYIATDDYNYSTASTTLSSALTSIAQYPSESYAQVQVYVTYKITVTNNSSIPTSVDEIVTYFDRYYYSYSDSYTTTEGNTIQGVTAYYKSSADATEVNYTNLNMTTNTASAKSQSASNMTASIGSLGGSNENEDITDMYISFGNYVILEEDQSLVLYLTYRLGENSTKNSKYNCTYVTTQNYSSMGLSANSTKLMLQDLLGENTSYKVKIYTISEINGYSTFYKRASDVSNTQTNYSAYYTYTSPVQGNGTTKYRAAGLQDSASTPGNLVYSEIEAASNNSSITDVNARTVIDDDWDKASELVIMTPGWRTLTGSVWETTQQAYYYTENDGYYPTLELDSLGGAENITVELIELVEENGTTTEYVRAWTLTDSSGNYTFTDYIPGNYVVRFTYGDKENVSRYSTYSFDDSDGISCSYNPQFYQSAKANPTTNNTQFWYATNSADGTSEDTRYSDAYDEALIREDVNGSLTSYTYTAATNYLVDTINKYYVYAYTSLIDVYPSKAATQVSGSTSKEASPSYTISNIDFALTRRTDAELEITKEVTHLKLVLQNGSVQFDVDTATIRAQGVSGVVQAAQGENIIVQMSSELVNGATLEITYTITIENTSNYDSVTYYKNSTGDVIAIALYEEDLTKLTYYEDGKIRTYDNRDYELDTTTSQWVSYLETGTTQLETVDTSKTITEVTETGAEYVADFISKNLTFNKTDYNGTVINEAWDIYDTDSYEDARKDFVTEYYAATENARLVYGDVDSTDVYESNVIVVANDTNALLDELLPGESVSEEITLSKVISVNSSSDADNKVYNNKVRILKIYNTVSKISEFPEEIESTSEDVIISDPTGIGNIYVVITLVLAVVVLIAGGIILIKKFVLTK